jgi:hypothetical protein
MPDEMLQSIKDAFEDDGYTVQQLIELTKKRPY